MTHDTVATPSLPIQAHLQSRVMELAEKSQPPAAGKPKRRGRPSVLSLEHLGWAILWCVLSGWRCQWDLWRLISFQGFGRFTALGLCDQAIYKRLGQQGMQAMQRVSEQITQALGAWQPERSGCELAGFASEILALDESILDPVKRWIRPLRELPKGSEALLAGRLSCLFDIRRQQWKRIDVLPEAKPNCKVHARTLLSGLSKGTLLLFDRGYHAYEWYDDLTREGFFWITRLSAPTSMNVVQWVLQWDGYGEALVQLGAYRSDQAEFPVRLIRLRIRGQWRSYLTNVLDPRQLTGAQVACLYARRWDIELAFRLLKEHLGLNLLWSAKWPVLGVQIWACAILAQLLHALQQEVAEQAGVEIFEVSLEGLVRELPTWLTQGEVLIGRLVAQGRRMHLIRPSSRREPEVPIFCLCSCHLPPDPDVFRRTPRYGHKAQTAKRAQQRAEKKRQRPAA